ncbi:KH domain-containing protein [Candidatus Falkowbacteria bacterium]|nr:KH domain-containing protein [Candidatus Falkowbacteria bacterium]
MENDQAFVEMVVKAIVSHPEDVTTERKIDERGVLITLHINQEDMGYVIGRQGQTARALRTLLKIVGARENARVNLKIYEPEGSRRSSFRSEHRSENAPAHDSMMDVDTDSVDSLKI